MNELLASSALLRSALSRYMKACSTATKSYNPSNGQETQQRTLIHHIIHELQAVATYEIGIQTAKYTLAQCRNIASTIAPINTLPPELLAQILILAYAGPRNCLTFNKGDVLDRRNLDATLSHSPHIPSHVCSRWRKIALNSCTLWSHVDIITSKKLCARLLPRAELFGTRAGSVLLNLHISHPSREGIIESSISISSQVSKTCSLLAPQTRCFRLDNLEKDGEGLSCLLHYFLQSAKPKVLCELRLLNRKGWRVDVLKPKDSSDQHDQEARSQPMSLRMTTQEIDELTRPVQVLWLRNIFFTWPCHAYIGLTDLRLIVDQCYLSDSFHIHIHKLEKILSSCPRLHNFHCNIAIDLSDAQRIISLISLPELEVVKLNPMVSVQASQLLSRISSGDKPLELSLSIPADEARSPGQFLPRPILDFFRRSCTTTLFLHRDRQDQRHAYSRITVPLSRLLSDLPTQLHTLGLNMFNIQKETEEPAAWPNQLGSLYMRQCVCDMATLQTFTRVCPIQILKLNATPFDPGADRETREKEVSKLAPITNSYWEAPADW